MRLFILLLMFGLSQARFAEPVYGSGSNSRQKRWIDFAGNWRKLLTGFHPAVQAVEENAQIRMAVESSPELNPIEYAHPVLPEEDPYQTNFNPGDEILYVSMTRNPIEGEPPKNKVELVQNTQPHYSEGSMHKRSADVQTYNPGERSALLGKGPRASVTHYSQVGGAQVVKSAAKVEELNTPVKISKRNVEDITLDNMELADMIIAESKTPEEALAKMLDAEKYLDSALHKVMGDLHESDAKDVKNLEQIIDAANNMKKTPIKRSIESNVEKAISKSSEHIAEAHNLLEKNDREEKALEEIMKADKNLVDFLRSVLPQSKIEESTKLRMKRDHNSEYFDSEFQWLVNNLQMTSEESDQVRNIVYGENSVDAPQFYKPVNHPSGPSSSYQSSVNSQSEPGQYIKYDQHPVYHTSESGHVYYTNERQNKMDEEKSTYQKFLDTLKPFADVVPPELYAAYSGATDVGKHVTKQVRPYAHQGYNKVTKEYIPQATQIVSSSVGKDVKDFARQGRKIVESRARYAVKAADPHLEAIKDDIWLLQEQLKQVAQETREYAKKEVVPSIGPTLNGLIFDIQETLELANQMIVNDVAPLVKKVSESYLKPTYSQVTSEVVYPVASKVNDYVMRPVAGGVNEYIVDPTTKYVVDPATKYVVEPVVKTAPHFYKSGVDTAQSTYHKIKPTLHQLSASTQKVLEESVVPTAQVAASQVAHGAYSFGNIIQSDVVPNVQQGVSTTLNGLFTGIPSLLKKVSHGANDAATIFSNRYAQALDDLKTKAEIKRKEQEAKLNMIKKEMKLMEEAEQVALNEIDDSSVEDAKKFDAVVKAFVEDVKDLEDTETTTKPINPQTMKPETTQSTTPKEL